MNEYTNTKYFGAYLRNVDSKGRVAIPKGLRKILQSRINEEGQEEITIYVEASKGAIKVYDSKYLKKDEESLNKKLNYSKLHKAIIDNQGRILLPRDSEIRKNLEGLFRVKVVASEDGEFLKIKKAKTARK
ncbi:hypothetical protein ACFLZZ_00630 [Nanoarchaeota archaeon]